MNQEEKQENQCVLENCKECPFRNTEDNLRVWRYTASYRNVVDMAVTIARADGMETLDTFSLFKAAVLLHPEDFRFLTGKDELKLLPVSAPEAVTTLENSGMVYSAGTEKCLSMFGGTMEKVFSYFDPEDEVDSIHIAAALLWEPAGRVKGFLNVNGINSVPQELHKLIGDNLAHEASNRHIARVSFDPERVNGLCRRIESYLRERCFGQDSAIASLLNQLALFWSTSREERKMKPLSLFFAGASGTGKNKLAELLETVIADEFHYHKNAPVDFARHADERMALDLVGRDSVWQGGGHVGVLTALANEKPRSIIRINNFDHGHPTAISYLISALTDGVLRDEFTGKDVPFADNIIIIVTNRGNEFLDSEEFMRLCENVSDSEIPRDKIIEGICSTFKNGTGREVSSSAMQSAFRSTLAAVSAPVLFRKHDAVSASRILNREFLSSIGKLERVFNLKPEIPEEQRQQVLEMLLDTQSNVESAHPLSPLVDAEIFFPVQSAVIRSKIPFSRKKLLRIVCTGLPPIEIPPGTPDSREARLKARTERRIAEAKRLDCTAAVTMTEEDHVPVFTLKIEGKKHIIMPNIEDAGFFTVRAPDVSFSDLVGAELVRSRIEDVLNYFKGKALLNVPRPPTGILLYGPPGTGKTSIAKAVARELGVPFISVAGSDFVCNDGIEKIKKLFSVARKYHALVFIDEIDALGQRGENSFTTSIINALLAELDGFVERNQLVMAATNRPDALDPALKRPGRISLRIELGELKKASDRRQLIQMTIQKFGGTISDELLEELVQTTGLWSPADLVELVNAGFRNAARSRQELSRKHFTDARTSILLGEENQKYELTRKDIHDTAVHEAGHAIVSLLHNRHFVQVTVMGTGNVAGFLEHRLDEERFSTKEDLYHQIEVSLAGRAAEIVSATPTDGCFQDFKTATYKALHAVMSGFTEKQSLIVTDDKPEKLVETHRAEIEKILRERLDAAVTLLKEHKALLDAAADRLTDDTPTMFEEDLIALRKEVEKL